MKEYKSCFLRNVGITGHGGSGKTSLVESLLFKAGVTKRIGKVEDGTTITDFEPEEIKRKISVNLALAPCEWCDHKINFIDTPGYADFEAEVQGALRAADSILTVVCAVSGVQVETEKVWNYAVDRNLPRVLFINKMDRENADFLNVLNQLKEVFGQGVLPLQLPIGTAEEFQGVIDVITKKAVGLSNKKESQELQIPRELLEQTEEFRQAVVEAVVEMDDDLLTKYLEGEEISTADIIKGLTKGIQESKIFPVLCGSAFLNIGLQELLQSVLTYLPSPEQHIEIGSCPRTQGQVERKYNDPFSAFVFKTTADPFVGRLSYIRIISGSMRADTVVYNSTKNITERIGNIYALRGKNQELVSTVSAGDIIVIAKLQETITGNTLCDKEYPVIFDSLHYSQPMYVASVEPKNKGDEDKIGNALQRMLDEDPILKLKKNTETGQLLVTGIGELHLDILKERLKRKFGVDVDLRKPKVPYRETIRTIVKVEGKHKKQSGGHGQYGHVWLQIEPLSAGKDFEFIDATFGGSVPKQYIPAVEKGVREALTGGVLAGYPLVDIKTTLYDGSYHTVDSSEMAFKIASSLALRKGALQAQPVLLEPIYRVVINVTEAYMGDVIGDLTGKRGRIQGMETNGKQGGEVRALVPLSELYDYAVQLRSITQGRGSFAMEFSHYEEMPGRLAEAIIASSHKDVK